jgi:hypothetical protein
MSDSTPYLDAHGIRREVPLLPTRHALPTEGLRFLALIADLGEPDSIKRRGWRNLVQVHGFSAVARAAARCYHLVDDGGRVRNEQAQAVLDGKLPCGRAIIRRADLARRRVEVA